MNGSHFSHIPEEEKKKKWFLLIEPLARTRNSRLHPQDSRLLQTLNKQEGFRTWKDIKFAMEVALVVHYKTLMEKIRNITILDPDPNCHFEHQFCNRCYQDEVKRLVKKFQDSLLTTFIQERELLYV